MPKTIIKREEHELQYSDWSGEMPIPERQWHHYETSEIYEAAIKNAEHFRKQHAQIPHLRLKSRTIFEDITEL